MPELTQSQLESLIQADAALLGAGLPSYTEIASELRALVTWAEYTGGWDAECWAEAETLNARLPEML